MKKNPFEETSKKLKEQAENIDKLPYFQKAEPKKVTQPTGPTDTVYSYSFYDSMLVLMGASYFVCIGLLLSSLLKG